MNNRNRTELDVARKVRSACIAAAEEAFREAAVSGLCMDGAVEAAVGAMQSLHLEEILDGENRD